MPPKPVPNTGYKTFVLYEQRFSIGETVLVLVRIKFKFPSHFLFSQNGGLANFIGTIERIYTDARCQVQVDLRWYYRPEVCSLPLWNAMD